MRVRDRVPSTAPQTIEGSNDASLRRAAGRRCGRGQHRSYAACPDVRQRHRVREQPAGQSRERVGRLGRRRSDAAGFRDRHQREQRRARSTSRSRRPPRSFTIDIYRLGYYGGMGARKVATLTPRDRRPQYQPACLTDAATLSGRLRQLDASRHLAGARDRGFRRLHREADAYRHRRRQPHRRSSCATTRATPTLIFQTSDTTWQAYNQYGGNSLYLGKPAARPTR